MSDLRCILHIGTEKTGTSTLQRLLRTNQSELLERGGVFRPETFGPLEHYHLVSYAIRAGRFFAPRARQGIYSKAEAKAHRVELRRQFDEEVKGLPPGTDILLSSERCFSVLRTDEDVARLVDMLSVYCSEVKVVVYLRPQHELCVSLYSTSLRNGYAQRDILPSDKSRMPHLDYHTTLERWGKAVGHENIDVRIFERSELLDGDIGADFFSNVLGLDLAEFESVPNENESLSVEAQLFLLQINKYLPRFEGKKLSQERGNVDRYVAENGRGKGMLPTEAEAREFFEYFAESNEAVRAKWFPERPSLFNVDFSKYPSEPIDYQLSQEDAFELFGKVWGAKHKEVTKLKAKNSPRKEKRGGAKKKHSSAPLVVSDTRYAAASEALRGGEPDKAVTLLGASVLESPLAAQSMYLLGISLCAAGNVEAGRSAIDRALELKPWVKDPDADVIDLHYLAAAALRSDPSWEWARYQTRLRGLKTVGLNLSAVADDVLTDGDTTVVQVGANDGKTADPIREYIANKGWSGVLVEPLAEPFTVLTALYRDRPDVALENAAISETDGVVSLYVDPERGSTLASMTPSRNALRKRLSKLDEIEARSITFESLFAKHGIANVDFLQIDTEGYDAEVLRLFSLSARPISVLNMEFYCLSMEERVRVLGELEQNEYAWSFDGQDLLAVRRSPEVDKRFAVVSLTEET